MNARDELEMLLHERIPDLRAAVAALRAEIEERKRIEAAAFRLVAMVESSHDAMIGVTPEGSIDSWNPAAERLLGYAAGEIIGKPASILVPAARQDEMGQILERAKRGERVQLETTRLTKAGSEIHVALAVSAVQDRNGALVGFSAIVRDVGERRRAEDALLRSEERFRNLVENAPNAMVAVDPEGRIVLANTRTEKLFGYAHEELLGQPVEMLVPDALRRGHTQHRIGYLAHPSARPMGIGRDLRGRRRDGSEFPVEIGLSPLQTEGGLVVSAAIVDISERKRAEAAMLRAQEQALVVAELSHYALAGTQPGALMDEAAGRVAQTLGVDYCGVWELLADGQSLVLRAGAGWKEGNVGRALIGAGGESPPGYALLTNAPVIVADLRTETRFRVPPILLDHGVLSTASVIIQGPHGHPFGVLGACNTKHSSLSQDDVLFLQSVANVIATANERKQAEELLRQAQKMEAIGRMTGGVAHDFNNLLTAISGNLQLLEERVAKDPLSHKLALAASKAAQRGAELIRSLLAFSRRQPLQSKLVDLNRLITGLGELLHRTLGETIDIEFALQRRALWPTLADPHQVESALLNLAINARDAMPEGGKLTIKTANVRLGADQARLEGVALPGQYVILAVGDNGTGMSPEVAARAFEPFFTTKEPGKGSGLGLSMVYGFAKQSGGHVGIASESGKGTTVKLYLPRAAGAVRPDAPAPRLRPRRRGHGSVLLVEDDEGVREFAATVLAETGYQVRQAAQAGEALAILEESGELDLLFTDLALPGGMSGQELAGEARRRRPDIKLLFASGYTEHDLVQQGRFDQGARLLAKPYTKEELVREVHLLVGGKPR